MAQRPSEGSLLRRGTSVGQGVARGGLEHPSSEERNPQRVTLAYEALFLGSSLPPSWAFLPQLFSHHCLDGYDSRNLCPLSIFWPSW